MIESLRHNLISALQMRKALILYVAAAVFMIALPAFSHDYWFEPESFFASPGGELPLKIKAGDDFKVQQEGLVNKTLTNRLEMFSPGQTQDLLSAGPDGKPAASLKFGPAGNYLVAMERKAQSTKLEAKEFTDYLNEEGLEWAVAERERRGESKAEGREQYTRYVKALFQVGDRHDDTYKQVVGHRLEIVPQKNPYEMNPGGKLQVLVLLDGKPLSGAKIFAYNRNNKTIQHQATTTSSGGLAEITLDRSGNWLVRLIHMRRCNDCTDSDWESFWAAFSFGLK